MPLWIRCFLMFGVLIGAATAAPPSGGQQEISDRDAQETSAPSQAEVSGAISAAAHYLERACGPEGKFAYRIDVRTGKEAASYNIVRHAGAMYALAMRNRSQDDPEASAALIRAAAFLRHNYIGPGARSDQLVGRSADHAGIESVLEYICVCAGAKCGGLGSGQCADAGQTVDRGRALGGGA
jgi:hypothetical protein